MKFIAPTILSLVSMTPTTADAWNMIGGPLFTPTKIYVAHPATVTRQRKRINRFFQDTQRLASPRYELVDNEDKFQLSVDVPGVKMDDINVSLEDGYLTVSGQRSSGSDESRFTSWFSQTFSLDAAVDVDQFSASLADGVLVVEAPKDMKRIEENITRIPVRQGKATPESDDSMKVGKKLSVADDNDENLDTLDLDAKHDDAVA